MKNHFILSVTILILILLMALTGDIRAQTESQKTRLIMMADMGNEPDEMQQNVHMLMYSNMFDLEGLIAVTSIYLKTTPKPWMYDSLVSAYAKVYSNLKKHASGWPDPNYLRSIVKCGIPGYGKAAVGQGKSSPGSNLIVQALLKNDPRKIYFVGNAGTNNLLQALWDLDAKHFGNKSQSEMDAITSKIIVFENGSQDNCGAWIAGEYPKIAWHRSNTQTYGWGGNIWPEVDGPHTWVPYDYNAQGQANWAHEHIMTNHGALGALYPDRTYGKEKKVAFLEGGGTTPWMGLANHGLTDPERLWWGGWSGRFSRVRERNVYSDKKQIKPDEMTYPDFFMYNSDSQTENWTDPVSNMALNNYYVPVFRFRRAMWNDFRARMDWCVKPYDQANHNPVAVFNGDHADTIIVMNAEPGQVITLDASASTDPDGDSLNYFWWIYKEAGTYPKAIMIPNDRAAQTGLMIPVGSDGREIHVILEVTDNHSIVSMVDYRRIVIHVSGENTNILPTCSIVSPSGDDDFIAPANIPVKVNVSDPDGSISFVELFMNDRFVGRDNYAPYQWSDGILQNLPADTYTLKAIATDNTGNTTTTTVTITVVPAGSTTTGTSLH